MEKMNRTIECVLVETMHQMCEWRCVEFYSKANDIPSSDYAIKLIWPYANPAQWVVVVFGLVEEIAFCAILSGERVFN